MLRVFCFLAFVIAAQSGLAPFIKPCKNGDSACVVQSAKAALPVLINGIPELDVKSIDPLTLPLIQSNEGGLKITFTDSVLTGLKDCTLENVKSDLKKMKQTVLLKCSVVLQGNYKANGQVLILPVEGQGKYKIVIKDILLKVVGDLETITGKDGKEHWHFKDFNYSFQVKTSVHFMFDNLFNGNKALADPFLEFLNANWKDVMEEIAPPLIRAVIREVINLINSFYKAVPAEELYLPS